MSYELIKTFTDTDGTRVVQYYYDESSRRYLVHGSLNGNIIMSKMVFNMLEADALREAFIAGTYDNLRNL